MAFSDSERKVVQSAIELIQREVAESGESVILRGFGTFQRVTTGERMARSPQTGEEVRVPARSVIRFKASKMTRKEI